MLHFAVGQKKLQHHHCAHVTSDKNYFKTQYICKKLFLRLVDKLHNMVTNIKYLSGAKRQWQGLSVDTFLYQIILKRHVHVDY